MRIKGDNSLAISFESEKASPLTDMWFCETLADMLDSEEQKALDGLVYVFPYKQAIVFDDGGNNGRYELVDVSNPTLIASWIKVSGGSSAGALQTDIFTITATDISNGFIDLSQTPKIGTETLYYDGLEEDESVFYTIATNRITFIDVSDIYIGAKITIKYSY